MRAFITGVTGQDGSYLAELLLEKNYEVYGMVRRTSLEKHDRILAIAPRIKLIEGDLIDQSSLDSAIQQVQPNEVYNLAAQSFVPVSWKQPVLTSEVTGVGVMRMLEAVRKHCPSARFLQASSSEMFGQTSECPQTETTPFHPRSPYGVAKVFGHQITVNYRESYGLFACSSICFNHESPRRGSEFVTRKVSRYVARAKSEGGLDPLMLGNLNARRDWGFAGDYVHAMWLMLQQAQPDDFVIATGEPHSVEDLLNVAFSYAGIDWSEHVKIDPALVRPAEVDYLCGNAAKAEEVLEWSPKVTFKQLVGMMVEHDLAALDSEPKKQAACIAL
jgi:GDPmannose 4,6-dehydratase